MAGPQKRQKPPKKIQVCNIVYEVVVDDAAFYKQVVDLEDLDLIGCCSLREARLFIKPGLALQTERDTLAHELGHAVWSAVGLPDVAGRDEEATISSFVPTYIDTLNRNPKLRKYLFND